MAIQIIRAHHNNLKKMITDGTIQNQKKEVRDFVEMYHGKINQKEMRERLGVSLITITRTVRELNLTNHHKSSNYMGAQRPEQHFNGIFNVNARWSWLAG